MSEFSRYRVATGTEGEFEPGSRRQVLRNRLGIVQKRAMDRAEFMALLAAQQRYVEILSQDTRFTSTLLRRMHRDWLGPIYPWAGRYRTVELAKGGFHWPPARLVGRNMARFSATTLRRHTPCRPGMVVDVARRLAEVHAELLLIHPFREGNGRLARWLADLMALQAHLPSPAYGFQGRGATARKRTYLKAVQQGYLGDYDLLVRFFAEALARAADNIR